MLKIALIDDHRLFREAMRALLASQEDLEVVAEASDAKEAYAKVTHHRPDVIVLDVSLPGVDGIAATRELKRRLPDGKILVLSMHPSKEYALAAFDAGAIGYIHKSQPAQVVMAAIRTVGRGEIYLPPDVPEKSATAARTAGALSPLSAREREVFELLVRGFSNQEVASELCISVKTVETHRAHIHRKLQVHSVGELVRFAALNGLVRA